VLRVTTNKLLAKCSLKDEMDETCGSQCTVQGKPESKRPVVGHRRVLQNNIKTDIKKCRRNSARFVETLIGKKKDGISFNLK
jgi:hypothetical protein